MADEAYKLNQINEAIKNLANFYNNYETIDTKKFDPKNLLDLLIKDVCPFLGIIISNNIYPPTLPIFGIITKGFADENSPNYMSVGTMKFLDVTLNLKDIKEALKTMDFKDERLRIYIRLLTETIRTDEIYNPDGTFRDEKFSNDWARGILSTNFSINQPPQNQRRDTEIWKKIFKNFLILFFANKYLLRPTIHQLVL